MQYVFIACTTSCWYAESYFWPDQNLFSLWILHEETSKFEKCKPMYLSTEKKSTNLKIKSGFDIAM